MAGKSGDDGEKQIMSPAEMKPILARARRGDPVSCAIGLTKEKDGVILLDKKKKPKKLFAEIKKQAVAAGIQIELPTLRFGRASVDPDVDAALVTFTVNKESSGAMRPRLLELLKKAGFTKVEIVVDEAIDAEPEDDDDTAAPLAAAASQDQAAPAASAAPQPDQSPAPAPAAAAPPPGADAQRALADLLKQMPDVLARAPDQKAGLLKLAAAATAAVKAAAAPGADPGQAATAVAQLRQAIDAALQSAGASPSEASASGAPASGAPAAEASGGRAGAAIKGTQAAIGKSSLAWKAARSQVEKQIADLHGEMMSAYKDHGFAADLDRFFQAKVEPVLGSLDESLIEKLDEVSDATDPATHAKLVGEARAIIGKYESYLAGEPLIAKLDANPFKPLQIQKTLTLTLEVLNKSLASVSQTVAKSMAA